LVACHSISGAGNRLKAELSAQNVVLNCRGLLKLEYLQFSHFHLVFRFSLLQPNDCGIRQEQISLAMQM
jgi:hypothetical protein